MIKHILEQLIRHLTEVKPKLQEFTKEDRFREDMGIDSLDMAEFVARVEQQFRVEIPDEDWPQIASLEKMAHYIANHG